MAKKKIGCAWRRVGYLTSNDMISDSQDLLPAVNEFIWMHLSSLSHVYTVITIYTKYKSWDSMRSRSVQYPKRPSSEDWKCSIRIKIPSYTRCRN